MLSSQNPCQPQPIAERLFQTVIANLQISFEDRQRSDDHHPNRITNLRDSTLIPGFRHRF